MSEPRPENPYRRTLAALDRAVMAGELKLAVVLLSTAEVQADGLAAEIDRLEAERDEAWAALERISTLIARWDAPLRHAVDDHGAHEKWAAVGSEATKIADDALAAWREQPPVPGTEGGTDD